MFFAMACRKYPKSWEKVPTYNNHSPHTLQYELQNEFNEERWKQITEIADFHKLNRRIKIDNKKNTYYKYIIENY